MKKSFDNMPRYQQIAIEIASRIVEGDLSEGDKLHGRSAIAGSFSVSPETARRAFCLLADMYIVTAEQGSGMRIKSRENAKSFIQQFSNQKDIESIKSSVMESIERQKAEMEQLNASLSDLIMATEHYRSMNPPSPYTIHITSECRFLEKSVRDVQLWQHTGATLVAIKRDGKLILSPGPYAAFFENDIIFLVSQALSDQKVRDYLFGKKQA